ncbi:hypothetical protein CBM2609_A60235 [Cupriavidus taiwanensis]|nr:hypothetical protein CBM2604_A50234 [Cupriavidus taiwanensis]SOZ27638.1 hypothetical protein CBM2609_A60235 [Cupriavidus taiwanensis]SOZ45965.1 hypothetical protein CBM2610_A70233 [Cupriavidus taiwanensis]
MAEITTRAADVSFLNHGRSAGARALAQGTAGVQSHGPGYRYAISGKRTFPRGNVDRAATGLVHLSAADTSPATPQSVCSTRRCRHRIASHAYG